MRKTLQLTEGNILSSLIRFTIPVILAMFLQAMYSAVDVMVVGHFAATADVSGVASTVFSGCGSLRAVVYLGEDGNVAKNKISTLGSFTVKSFDEFDATVDYGAGSDKIIFAGAKTLDGANYVSYTAYDKPFSI